MTPPDEFYVGWEDRAPRLIASRARRAVVVALVVATGLAVVLALAQRTIGVAVFEWGHVRSFTGVFRRAPYPHLVVPRPGGTNDLAGAFSSYHLVRPFKYGISPGIADHFDGVPVALKGTLIHRAGETMIEVVDDSIRENTGSSGAGRRVESAPPVELGRQTLQGEIVDSKCYLGVMNPGVLAPHRACAIHCISGGIPPMLVVRQEQGEPRCLLLVAADGRPVNQQVLGLVGEPVEITGDVQRTGDGGLLILRADPSTYRRVSR